MRMTGRRAALAGIGAAAAGTVAAALIVRKPSPHIYTPIVPPSDAAPEAPRVRLSSLEALTPTTPARPLPAIALFDASGGRHTMTEFAGRGVVLNLWATWCVPCVAELPALARLAERAQAAGLAVVPLSSDRGGAPVVEGFLAAHGLSELPVWLDPKGDAARALGARGVPTTILVDAKGMERGRLEGAADWGTDAAVEHIKALLA